VLVGLILGSTSVTLSYCTWSAFGSSMAVHPDKVTVATGQVAGHDKLEGKVGSQHMQTFV